MQLLDATFHGAKCLFSVLTALGIHMCYAKYLGLKNKKLFLELTPYGINNEPEKDKFVSLHQLKRKTAFNI